jgi:NADPH2:quinone reductase
MKAINFEHPGEADVLELVDLPIPPIKKSNQILIKVSFSGVNRPDLIQRLGNYPAPEGHSKILGLEVSGVILEIGQEVKRFKKGDKVAALVNGGGYAEYCIAEEETTFKIPCSLDLQQAASIPECFFTAWSNLIQRGKLKEGDSVLVHGGTSGIGLASIEILKLFKTRIFTTVGSAYKKEFCKNIGVNYIFNYKEEDYYKQIKKINIKGLDLILDYIGGEYINKNINLLANDGKLINIGFQNGSRAEINLMKVMLKRLTISGSTLRIRNNLFKNKILEELTKYVFPYFKTGQVKCYIDSVFHLSEASKAHKRLDEGVHIGKVILKI